MLRNQLGHILALKYCIFWCIRLKYVYLFKAIGRKYLSQKSKPFALGTSNLKEFALSNKPNTNYFSIYYLL